MNLPLLDVEILLNGRRIDKDYLFKLELAQSKLLQLQRGWSTTSTAARYNSYLENAPRKSQEVIARETGSPLPPMVIRWMEPIVAPAVSAEDADPEVDEIEDVEDATDAIPVLTPTQVIMENLTHGEGEDFAAEQDQTVGPHLHPPLSPRELRIVTQVRPSLIILIRL